MKTSQLKQSRYLKKEDVEPPVDVTIEEVREENVALQEEEERLRWIMYFRELQKGLVLNVENGELLEEITGSDDSDNWLGQRIQLWADPKIKFGGKRVGGIRIRRIGGFAADPTEEVNQNLQITARSRTRQPQPPPPAQPHPNEIRSAEERQRLHTKGYGNAEERDEDGIPF